MSVVPSNQVSEFAIVGAGIAGCSLAFELSKRGVSLTLLDKRTLGEAGASSVPVALLNPYRGKSAKAREGDLAGLGVMREVAAELEAHGLESGVHFSGVLRIASNQKQAKNWQKREGPSWLETNDIPESYHAPHGGFLVEDGGWLEPDKLLHALTQAASKQAKRMRVLEHCELEGLGFKNNLYSLTTSRGELQAKTVILCPGAEANPHLPLPELSHVAGEVIGLASQTAMPYPLAGSIYGAKRGELIHIGGNHRPEHAHDPDAPKLLRKSAGWFLPPLKDAPIAQVWRGVRAAGKDNVPIVKELRAHLWFFGALAGRGFLVSGQLARELAETLTSRPS